MDARAVERSGKRTQKCLEEGDGRFSVCNIVECISLRRRRSKQHRGVPLVQDGGSACSRSSSAGQRSELAVRFENICFWRSQKLAL